MSPVAQSSPVAFCPNCNVECSSFADHCSICGALFGPDAAWKPSSAPDPRPQARPAFSSAFAAVLLLGVFLPLLTMGALLLAEKVFGIGLGVRGLILFIICLKVIFLSLGVCFLGVILMALTQLFIDRRA
jgi:hypothetical protein